MAQHEPNLNIIIDTPPINHQDHPTKNPKKPKPSIILNINASYFRICISLGSQALLWKTLSEKTEISPPFHLFLKLPSTAFHLLWYLTLFVSLSLSLLYLTRCIFHLHLVKSELHHHVGVNYLFAPWISWLLLLQSSPSFHPNEYLWWVLVIPVVGLDVKVYGQWFTTEKRFLSTVANPTSQMSVIGNFVGAHAAVKMGWKESGVCLFTLGLTHYMVVFITLYQRLAGGDRIPARLRPVFFLFVATPSMAALAWKAINGSFDIQCKMLFFLSLFLFASLTSRPMLFKKSMKEFSVAWWAFSFPLTFLALAATAYAQQVKSLTANGLALVLSVVSVLVFIFLLLYSTLKIDALLNKPILKFYNNSSLSTIN